MNENQIRNIVKKVFIMIVLSVIPLIFCVGCGKSKMTFLDCVNNLDGLVSLIGNILDTIVDLLNKIINNIIDIFN